MRMRDSGHALVTEVVQRMVGVDVTSEDEGVGAPGVNSEVGPEIGQSRCNV